MVKPVGCAMTGHSTVQGQCDYAACNYPFCEVVGSYVNKESSNSRELILHKSCSIVKGLVDNGLLPSDIAYPLTIITSDLGVLFKSASFLSLWYEL